MISKYSSSTVFKRKPKSESKKEIPIMVCIRKRPFNEAEIARGEVDVISVPTNYEIVMHAEKSDLLQTKYVENQHFRFDYAFDEESTNVEIYRRTAKPLVRNIFNGGMSTCIAYGEAESGKTHTMAGRTTPTVEKGLFTMTAVDAFKLFKSKYKKKLMLGASYFELYCGEAYDLLEEGGKLKVREDRHNHVMIEGLTEKLIKTKNDLLEVIEKGNNSRTSDVISDDYRASRSHAVFQIILRKDRARRLYGKFSLIDLAGNERAADTDYQNYETKIEGSEINKSILSLKECIRAMSRRNSLVPFRGNRLTQILRDSFIGKNCKACLIAMLKPGHSSYEYSLNTLRFANRVK